MTWNGQSEYSSSYTRIRSYCCTTSQTLTQPNLVTYQEYYINNDRPFFSFASFTAGNNVCPISTGTPYSFYTTNAGTTRVSNMRYTYATWDSTNNYWKWETYYSVRNTENLITFAFTPTVDGGHVHWATDVGNASQVM